MSHYIFETLWRRIQKSCIPSFIEFEVRKPSSNVKKLVFRIFGTLQLSCEKRHVKKLNLKALNDLVHVTEHSFAVKTQKMLKY